MNTTIARTQTQTTAFYAAGSPYARKVRTTNPAKPNAPNRTFVVVTIPKRRTFTLSPSSAPLLPPARVSMADVEYGSHLLTKGIFLYFFFLASLNWFHYRNMRKDMENEGDAKQNDTKNKTRNDKK